MGLPLFFLPNFPGAMFIQGATFIPDSRVHKMFSLCSELGIFIYWTCNSMNNLLSYCGLVDARMSASEKDLPVPFQSEI